MPRPTRLDDVTIAARLRALSGWERVGDTLRKTYVHATFAAAIAFVNAVAARAEARDHHPDLLVEYNRVTLTLTTHDAGGLTILDFDLAAELDA
jgi:4a-hydroxytetrahydrobiopterin dehydratase